MLFVYIEVGVVFPITRVLALQQIAASTEVCQKAVSDTTINSADKKIVVRGWGSGGTAGVTARAARWYGPPPDRAGSRDTRRMAAAMPSVGWGKA